jgi:hypothetical protein
MNSESEKIREYDKITTTTFWKPNYFHTLFSEEVNILILDNVLISI